MASVEFSAHSPRISDADREHALDVLRDGMAEGRVSQDTFLHRVELVMAAQLPHQLYAAVGDLPGRRPAGLPAESGWFVRSFTRMVTVPGRLRLAWQAQRLPKLVLPAPGPAPLAIGRAAGCGLRLNDASVSRHHAQLSASAIGWLLRDLGSANGTWVNHSRVVDALPVRPGDQVRFGAVAFVLTARES